MWTSSNAKVKVEGHFSKTKLNEKSLTVIQATAIAAPKILVLMRRC